MVRRTVALPERHCFVCPVFIRNARGQETGKNPLRFIRIPRHYEAAFGGPIDGRHPGSNLHPAGMQRTTSGIARIACGSSRDGRHDVAMPFGGGVLVLTS